MRQDQYYAIQDENKGSGASNYGCSKVLVIKQEESYSSQILYFFKEDMIREVIAHWYQNPQSKISLEVCLTYLVYIENLH